MNNGWKVRIEKIKDWFNRNLFQIEDSKERKAWAVAWGVFMAIFPLWGLQTIIALAGAQLFKLNKIIVLCASGLSVFPVMPLLMYAGHYMGSFFVTRPTYLTFSMQLSKDDILPHLTQYLIGSSVLAVFSAVVFGSIAYWGVGRWQQSKAS